MKSKFMREPFELYEFFSEGKRLAQSHVLLHITENAPEEEGKGSFFAICEIQEGTVDQIEHVQRMIDDLESGYYESNNDDKKHAFECALEFINHRGHHVLGKDGGEIDCFVGVIEDNTLYFAAHGTPQSVLMYHEEKSWNIMNLLEGKKTNHTEKLFSRVTEGSLADDDLLFIGTPGIAQVFPEGRLQHIFTSRPPASAIAYVQKTLDSQRSDRSFGGLLIHQPKKKRPFKEKELPLIIPETHKKNIPSNKQKITAQESKKSTSRSETNYRPRPSQKKSDEPLWNRILIMVGKILVMMLVQFALLLKHIVIGIWKQLLVLFLITTNHGNQRKTILDQYKQSIYRKKQYITSLSLLSKILFVSALGLIIIFSVSIWGVKYKKEQAQIATIQEQTLTDIQERYETAEASMLYGNESKALRLLEEIQTLIEGLPEGAEINDIRTNVEEKTKTLQRKLQKIEDANPMLIEDLGSYGSLTRIAYADGGLFLYTDDSKDVLLLNPSTKSIETKHYDSVPAMIHSYVPKEEENIIFVTNQNSIVSWDVETKGVKSQDISYPTEETTITAIATYNKRLYTLDPIHNQIFKHNPTVSGYDRGSAWLATDVDITGAIDIGIDGRIYILKQTGEVLVFERGKPVSFHTDSIKPVLAEPVELWVRYEHDHIYILDRGEKRIVEITKDGKLIRQYQSDMWESPQSFTIDLEKEILYLLDDKKVYSIDISFST